MFKVNTTEYLINPLYLIVVFVVFWTIVAKKAPELPGAFLDYWKEDYFLMNFVLTDLPCDSTCNKYMPWLYLEQSTLKMSLFALPS